MIRKFLFAGVAALTLVGPARAQLVTIDPAEIEQVINTLHQLQQAYQVALGTYGTLLRVTNPNALLPGLIGSNPLPAMPQIGGMISGGGSFGSLGGLASQFLRSNTVYSPQSFGPSDYNALYLQRNGNTLAGVQAMAGQSLNSLQTHISGLVQIQGQLSSLQSQADLTAIQGRLQAETANLQAQQVQAASLQTMMQAQQQQYQLQGEQLQRQSADALMASVNGGSSQLAATSIPTFSTQGSPGLSALSTTVPNTPAQQAAINQSYNNTVQQIWQTQANQAETSSISTTIGPNPSMNELFGPDPLLQGN